eukprot:TRINITY_DN3968_c0_g1_i4.p1 TRINITY_DN3968_c0_g1~~TRINITY_DN3968_c0_g1_i4.p1  ORF type:complete len:299 (-),score=37.01 TRINITY_DN3968_c0_g1_i4:64-915(-)
MCIRDRFIQTPDEPLGSIPLEDIFEIGTLGVGSVNSGRYGFAISAGKYMKKNVEMGRRVFCLSAPTVEEVEDWLTFIELARTYAIYNQFTQKFGRVNFPLASNNDEDYQSRSLYTSYFNSMQNNDETSKTYKLISKDKRKTNPYGQRISKSTDVNGLSRSQTGQMTLAFESQMKARVEVFLQATLHLFWSHIIEKPKHDMHLIKLLGQPNQSVFQNPNIFNISDDLLADIENKSESVSIRSSAFGSVVSKNVRNSVMLQQVAEKLNQAVEEEEDDGEEEERRQ